MTANDIHLLTGAYVLDSLDDADREVFGRHLDECEGCAGEVAELRETVVRLAEDSWAVPTPRLRQTVPAPFDLHFDIRFRCSSRLRRPPPPALPGRCRHGAASRF